MNTVSRIAIALACCLVSTPGFTANMKPVHAFHTPFSNITLAASKTNKEDKKAEKEAEKAAREAEKEAEKAAREAEKEARKENGDVEDDTAEAELNGIDGPADQIETTPEVIERTGPTDLIDDIIDNSDDVFPTIPDETIDTPSEGDIPSVPEVTAPPVSAPPVVMPPVVAPPLTGNLGSQLQELRNELTDMRREISDLRDTETDLKIRRQRGLITQEEYKKQIRALREQEAMSLLKMNKIKKAEPL